MFMVFGTTRTCAQSSARPKLHRTHINKRKLIKLSCTVNIFDRYGIKMPNIQEEIQPDFNLSHQQALLVQLQCLKENDSPYRDHGIEVLYRFSDFDPWSRSNYFGKYMDLGQFERFRRVFHQKTYSCLLSYQKIEHLSSLQVMEQVWQHRVRVFKQDQSQQFAFTLTQRVGSKKDGYWFTSQLICEAQLDKEE